MDKLWAAFCLMVLWVGPALAGAGGEVADTLLDTPWGKVLLVLLGIVLLPLMIYTLAREWLAERRTRRDLRFMAAHDPAFAWGNLEERVKECFHQVHAAWSVDTIAEAAPWMTPWYCQNQRRQLERWEREGVTNVCEVKRLGAIKPLFFEHRNHGSPHQGSLLVVSLRARMKDYLVSRATGRVVEGSKSVREVETLWIFVLRDGLWQVNGLEEPGMSLIYARLAGSLPPIETTLGDAQLR